MNTTPSPRASSHNSSTLPFETSVQSRPMICCVCQNRTLASSSAQVDLSCIISQAGDGFEDLQQGAADDTQGLDLEARDVRDLPSRCTIVRCSKF